MEKKKKPFYKRWWFILLAFIVIIGAIVGGGEEDVPKVADQPAETTESTVNQEEPEEVQEQEVAQEFFAIGEVVETNSIRATVTGIEKPAGNQVNKPSEGHEFVIVNLTLENISDKELNISSLLGFNAYVDDTAINEDLGAQIAKEGSKTVDGTIAPGKKLSGILGYEAPVGWEQIEIHFEPETFGNTTIKWIITNE